MAARRSRSVRRTNGGEGSRNRLPSYLSAVLFAVSAGSPVTVFPSGRNLCKVVPLAALRSVAGQRYKPGLMAGGTCTWERADLRAGMTLTTHPRAAGLTLMRQFLAQKRFAARKVALAGAQEAVLAEVSARSKYLFAAYRRGVIQVNMTGPTAPPDARLLAVMRLVARRA